MSILNYSTTEVFSIFKEKRKLFYLFVLTYKIKGKKIIINDLNGTGGIENSWRKSVLSSRSQNKNWKSLGCFRKALGLDFSATTLYDLISYSCLTYCRHRVAVSVRTTQRTDNKPQRHPHFCEARQLVSAENRRPAVKHNREPYEWPNSQSPPQTSVKLALFCPLTFTRFTTNTGPSRYQTAFSAAVDLSLWAKPNTGGSRSHRCPNTHLIPPYTLPTTSSLPQQWAAGVPLRLCKK